MVILYGVHEADICFLHCICSICVRLLPKFDEMLFILCYSQLWNKIVHLGLQDTESVPKYRKNIFLSVKHANMNGFEIFKFISVFIHITNLLSNF